MFVVSTIRYPDDDPEMETFGNLQRARLRYSGRKLRAFEGRIESVALLEVRSATQESEAMAAVMNGSEGVVMLEITTAADLRAEREALNKSGQS